MLTLSQLMGYEGSNISTICPHGYDSSRLNHCAHFVSHVLQLSFGKTCADMTGRGGAGANIRVQEVFDRCRNAQIVLACPSAGEGLVFVSAPSNFRGSPVTLRNVPKKHIGLLLDGTVWHYSNTRDRVVKQTVGEFLFHYPRQKNAIWFAEFPIGARPTDLATSS